MPGARQTRIAAALVVVLGGCTAVVARQDGEGAGAAAGAGAAGAPSTSATSTSTTSTSTTSTGAGASSGTGGAGCDAVDCGRPGHSCLGGCCVDGACQPVVLADLGATGATAVALDRGDVWWASPVQRIAKDGGPIAVVADSGSSNAIWGIALDESQVYWTSAYDGLFAIDKSGGPPLVLGKGGYRIAVDQTHVFTAWEGVWKVAKGGGATEALANEGGQGIALDESFVYFTTWIPGGVSKVPKAGGPVTQLAAMDASAYVAVSNDTVYWTSQGGGTSAVRAVPKDGGAVVVLAEALTPYGVAADADGVYWTDFDEGTIWMLPASGGPAVMLASNQHNPRDLAVDESAVYWTNDAILSAISKVAKP